MSAPGVTSPQGATPAGGVVVPYWVGHRDLRTTLATCQARRISPALSSIEFAIQPGQPSLTCFPTREGSGDLVPRPDHDVGRPHGAGLES